MYKVAQNKVVHFVFTGHQHSSMQIFVGFMTTFHLLPGLEKILIFNLKKNRKNQIFLI